MEKAEDRSKRSRQESEFDADEYAAAKTLLLLFYSDGGFCTESRIKKQKINSRHSPSSVLIKNTPRYSCHVCGKVMQSHQALGGHMTSHRAGTSFCGDPAAATANGRLHECSICCEKFETGQALGGHMRKHYQRPSSTSKVGGVARDSGGESSSGDATYHVRPQFDLNLLPSSDMDGDQEVYGIGC